MTFHFYNLNFKTFIYIIFYLKIEVIDILEFFHSKIKNKLNIEYLLKILFDTYKELKICLDQFFHTKDYVIC